MTNYIIDPQVFYWMNILNGFKTAALAFAIITGVGSVVLILMTIYSKMKLYEPTKPDENASSFAMREYEQDLKKYEEEVQSIRKESKWTAICFLVFIVFVCAAIFIPSKQTSIEMLIVKTATLDNVNWTVQQVKEIVDYIVRALKGVV